MIQKNIKPISIETGVRSPSFTPLAYELQGHLLTRGHAVSAVTLEIPHRFERPVAGIETDSTDLARLIKHRRTIDAAHHVFTVSPQGLPPVTIMVGWSKRYMDEHDALAEYFARTHAITSDTMTNLEEIHSTARQLLDNIKAKSRLKERGAPLQGRTRSERRQALETWRNGINLKVKTIVKSGLGLSSGARLGP